MKKILFIIPCTFMALFIMSCEPDEVDAFADGYRYGYEYGSSYYDDAKGNARNCDSTDIKNSGEKQQKIYYRNKW